MRPGRLKALLWVGVVTVLGLAAALSAHKPFEIGSTRQLFVDSSMVETLQNASLALGHPSDQGSVLQLDRPWEGPFSGYFTVIRDASLYRMYYRGKVMASPAAKSWRDGSSDEVTCYAESPDGANWSRPDLGLYEVAGTRKNNVILADAPPYSHNFCPFLDTRPGVDPSERYKAVAGLATSGLVGFVSPDGIHWRKIREEHLIPSPDRSALDSQNVPFWSESERQYVCYLRTWKVINGQRYRWISRTSSPDFLNWSPIVEMDYGDAPAEHLYTNQTSPYFRAPGYYVGVCARFEPGRRVITDEQARELHVDSRYPVNECSDAVLVTSRGGNHYDRQFLEAFLRPGLGLENWVPRSNYPALNVVPTSESQMSFYVNRNYGQPTSYVGRYTLRMDGFASVRAPYRGGSVTTKPFRFSGTKLEINYSTSAAGGIQVELEDETGSPLPGYSAADCPEIIGDQISRTVRWTSGEDLSGLAGRAIRLKVLLKDADLYSFRFAD